MLSQTGGLQTSETDCWAEVANFLRAASVVASVDIDIDALDPVRAGTWCRPAWDYNQSEQHILADYFHALNRYYFAWSAYEAARDGTAIGKVMKSRRKYKGKLMQDVARCPLDAYPYLRDALFLADSLVRSEEGSFSSMQLQGGAPVIDLTAKLLTLSEERFVFEQASLLLREFRHYAFHGEEQPPSPDESPEHFRQADGGWHRSLKAMRMEAMTRLTLIVIQVIVLSSRESEAECIHGHDIHFLLHDAEEEEEFYLGDVLMCLNLENVVKASLRREAML